MTVQTRPVAVVLPLAGARGATATLQEMTVDQPPVMMLLPMILKTRPKTDLPPRGELAANHRVA